MDTTIEEHLTKIITALNNLLKAWKADKVRDEKSLRKLNDFTEPLEQVVNAAYRDHAHEKDAWKVGDEVRDDFRAQANKKKK
jgi:hypothetical protein